MLKLTIISFCTLAKQLVYYKFGSNFGQIFYDYSGNGNHGQNGNSISNITNDIIPTDRGAYYVGVSNYIMLPPNDKVPTPISLESTFSILLWVKPLDNRNYYITYRIKDASNYFFILKVDIGNILRTRIARDSYDSNTIDSTIGNINESNFY